MSKKPEKASENMQIFFNKLVNLKQFIKEKNEEMELPVLQEIYEKLDEIFKVEKQ